MEERFTTANLFIPYNEGKKISAVQNGVEVLNKIPDEKGVYFTIKGSRNRIEHLQKMVNTSIK